MKKLYIFTTPNCKFCKNLVAQLTEQSISFTQLFLHENREIAEFLKKEFGEPVLQTPILFFQEKDDGEGYIYYPGKDFETIPDIISIIKSNIEI